MRIIILKETGIAFPSKEGREALAGNKLTIQIVDAEEKEIEAKAKLCARTFYKALSLDAIEEGIHPLIIEHGGKQYSAAIITRHGSKVVVTGCDHQLMVKAAVAAEKAILMAQKNEKRSHTKASSFS